mgnify:CR=1 FL=1
MKYVSCKCTSTEITPRYRPVDPPIINKAIKLMPYNMLVFQLIEPLYIVASQLNTLTADGIATLKVMNEKITLINGDWPDVNMWCPHTKNENIAIAIELHAMKEYPNM